MELQTVKGSIVGNRLLHDGIAERIFFNQFHCDVEDDYILIRRVNKKVIIIDYFRRNFGTGDVSK